MEINFDCSWRGVGTVAAGCGHDAKSNGDAVVVEASRDPRGQRHLPMDFLRCLTATGVWCPGQETYCWRRAVVPIDSVHHGVWRGATARYTMPARFT